MDILLRKVFRKGGVGKEICFERGLRRKGIGEGHMLGKGRWYEENMLENIRKEMLGKWFRKGICQEKDEVIKRICQVKLAVRKRICWE